jgi:hypothetical protein
MNEDSQITGRMPASSPPVPTSERRGLTVLLSVILAIGVLIFAVGLFKHISYPLMWADESMTAVGAERVLDYGYPKVHDGRNVFYDLRHSDMTLGIDKKTDAYIGGAGWGHYYFAAPFVALSKFASDMYLKTAMLRIPFALAGCAGLLLLLWTGVRPLERRLDRLAVAVLFVVLELPSVTLMLHMREVRYYSLQLLLTAIALGAFAAYHLYSTISFRVYAAAVVCLVPLLFLTFSPAAAAFYLTIFLYLAGEWLIAKGKGQKKSVSAPDQHGLRTHLLSFLPMLASLALVAPLAWFFRTLYISRKLEEFYGFTFTTYLEHVGVVWGYFVRYEVIAFALAAKVLLALFWRRVRNDAGARPALKLSLLLTIFFIAQALLVGKVPNPMFTRYFIMLQPLLALAFALDLMVLARLASGMERWRKTAGTTMVTLLLVGSIGWAFSQNRLLIKGRLYEITHQYEGVLDFVIPFLQERYAHPERLIIATNYEETSYIYYLDCRVIVGFLTPNLDRDLSERPDCIIFRTFWSRLTDTEIYNNFISRGAFGRVRFPVYDNGVNNIPETVHWTPRYGWTQVGEVTLRAFRREDWTPPWGWRLLQHYFGTVTSDIPEYQVTIYLRREDAASGPTVR